MGGRKRLIELGGDFVFACLDMELRSRFAMMGATKIFQIFNDIRSAIKSLNWQSGRNPDRIKISFPSNLTLVPAIRQLTSRIAKQKGYSNRDAFRIETIVDEICNNAVEHGKQGNDQTIDFAIEIDPKKIELDITNTSDPEKISSLKKLLKPKEVKELSTEETRGRGLALIKMLSDELSVNCSEKGTVVHVKKIREE
jgi:anti-sigma regulatory factor (Ser/Thr protein kinase)